MPERCGASFIKFAPIFTSIESVAKSIGNTAATFTLGKEVASTVTTISEKAPIVFKGAEISRKIGQIAFDFFVPRSALTYSPDEALRYVARDLKLGLVSEDDMVKRLVSKYHLKASDFTDDLVSKLNSEISKDLGEETIGFNKIKSSFEKESLIYKIKNTPSNKEIPVSENGIGDIKEMIPDVDKYKDTNELAERILRL